MICVRMPCRTHDLSVKIRLWEFGSSPTWKHRGGVHISRIVKEIETERELVEANRKLIKIYERKIQAKLSEIWGSEEG